MTSTTRRYAIALGFAALGSLHADQASAQDLGRMTERTFYATLVSGSDEISNKPVVVIRRPSAMPHDIILIDPKRATSADLGAALEVLEHLKAQDGDSVKGALRAAPSGRLNRAFRDGENDRLRSYLSYLSSAPVQNVQGIGWAHTIALTVPRAAFADKLEQNSRKP
jgi:hypothetical protein